MVKMSKSETDKYPEGIIYTAGPNKEKIVHWGYRIGKLGIYSTGKHLQWAICLPDNGLHLVLCYYLQNAIFLCDRLQDVIPDDIKRFSWGSFLNKDQIRKIVARIMELGELTSYGIWYAPGDNAMIIRRRRAEVKRSVAAIKAGEFTKEHPVDLFAEVAKPDYDNIG